MVDTFLDAGFNYFDTAHGYLQGKKRRMHQVLPVEPLSARGLCSMTDKLTMAYFKKQEDIRPF